MRSRSNDNSALRLDDPWIVSTGIHGLVLAAVLLVVNASHRAKTVEVDIRVLEAPRPTPQPQAAPIRLTAPRERPVAPPVREVFGISPRALTSDAPEAEPVKAGNTVAKAPDQEVLKPGDPDALPIPKDEYLVTNMPVLRSEVRIAYPAASKRKGVQGAVVMDLLIDETGKVREVALIEGPNEELSNAAMTAARAFKFSPAQVREKTVAVRIRYVYRFVLER